MPLRAYGLADARVNRYARWQMTRGTEPAESPQRLVLVGPPASGKGTQGRRLAAALGLAYLSTGALLREHVEGLTEIGRLAKPILDRGGYLPDELMCGMVSEWIAGATTGWLLDGFPRSVPQAEFLGGWLAKRHQTLDAAIALEAPFEVLKERIHGRVECPECRWSGGKAELNHDLCPACAAKVEARADDTDENFLSRYNAYVQSAMPLVGYYRERGMLCACDATRCRDEVTADLLRRLTPDRVPPQACG